jgi:hypothetical protein
MPAKTLRVTLAYAYTDKAGKSHDADSTVNLPRAEANDLLHFGRARVPDTTASSAATEKKE